MDFRHLDQEDSKTVRDRRSSSGKILISARVSLASDLSGAHWDWLVVSLGKENGMMHEVAARYARFMASRF